MSNSAKDSASASESKEPKFITLEEAASMTSGTRVTFIPGIQALFSEALKNICYVKKVPLIRALHPIMGQDRDTGADRQAKLYELTSQTGLPTMFHDQERPRNVWIEQLALAERIGAEGSPVLLPENFEARADVLGLCAIVLGEDGFAWNMRILNDSPLAQKYGFSEKASAAAPTKLAEILELIDETYNNIYEFTDRLGDEALEVLDEYVTKYNLDDGKHPNPSGVKLISKNLEKKLINLLLD